VSGTGATGGADERPTDTSTDAMPRTVAEAAVPQATTDRVDRPAGTLETSTRKVKSTTG
jgi:hypothetical protein